MNNHLRDRLARIEFQEQSDFGNFLVDMNKEDTWLTEDTASIRIGYITPESTPEYNFTDASEEQVNNAFGTGSLFVKLISQNMTILLNDNALFTLKDRAGITCKHTSRLLSEGKKMEFCHFANLALPEYVEKRSLILLRAGQVLAVHSSNYVPLNQMDIYNRFFQNIKDRFPNAKFDHAVYTHNLTNCTYCLSNYKDTIMDAYREAWIAAGLKESALERSFPVLKVNTSDSGEFCLEMEPILKVGAFYYPLGDKILIKHHGTAHVGKLDASLNKLFAKLEAGVTNIANLLMLEINYPVPVMVRALEEAGIVSNAKKACKNLVEAFTSCVYPGKGLTAFDIYLQICDIQYTDEFQKMSPATKLKITENFHRLLTLDWVEMDEPGKVEVI